MTLKSDAFKDKETAEKLALRINNYSGRPIKLMEVCGTHTMAISRFGIRSILPENIKLISGPGCPVCVTPSYYIKGAVELARRNDVIVASFGDMLRIPSVDTNLLQEKAKGADIRIVYSPLDSIDIAINNQDKKVVFLSVGFETTIPVIALALLNALERGVENFMLLTANKTIPAAMHVLSSDKDVGVDGYLYPGHVSAIIGDGLYRELAEKYGIPGVITGFDPLDILGSIIKLSEHINSGEAVVDNLYSRVVKPEGNKIAIGKIYEVFEECDSIWRGIGNIPGSGLRLKGKYKAYDASSLLNDYNEEAGEEPKGCRCGDILKGKCGPKECKLFGTACTPENPIGSCMVSSEGTCAAYYKYS